VIFSGDGDFRSLVEALQRRGRKVSVVSTMASQPPMISDDLRRQADHFIDLVSLKAEVGREMSERPVRRPETRARPAQTTETFWRGIAKHRMLRQKQPMSVSPADPSRTIARCARVCINSLLMWRRNEASWFNAPVPTFLPRGPAGGVRCWSWDWPRDFAAQTGLAAPSPATMPVTFSIDA
jgi:hypothetical protein